MNQKSCTESNNVDSSQFLEEVNSIRQTLLERLNTKWQEVDRQYGMHDRLIAARYWTRQHPIIAVFLLTTFIICALPLLCFLASLLGICFVIFTGFIVFEGSLLTLGTGILGLICLFGALLTLGFTSTILTGYLLIEYGSLISVRFRKLTKGDNPKLPNRQK